MAIYHLEAKIITRGEGRSAVAGAAYIGCDKIYNEYDGVQHDYTKKQGLVWEQVFLPDNAPDKWKDRAVLWNAVEESEKSKDSRLAREFVVALPIELKKDEWVSLLSEFIKNNFVSDGMCADVAIHDTDGHNPHAHKIIELPLSSKDESGTAAGGCIGYIAIGQSGSGKSSFFHSLVLNGCFRYSPKELQFWLLDFKYGGASSKYINSGLPHIKMIAENNKIDDALCLFQMVLEEMELRNARFNAKGVNDIVEYNKSLSNKQEYLPRIIVAIDEIQEIFRVEEASKIKDLISEISSRMRSAGIHFVMIAQNLCDGKSYMLKEAFLNHAKGRVCFRVESSVPRESGFDEDFSQRKQEISELKTGEAFVSYGKGTIGKIKIAYAPIEDMPEKCFGEIKNKYSEFSGSKPLIIGSKKSLSIKSYVQGKQQTYYDILCSLALPKRKYSAVIGEDAYKLEPLCVDFSPNNNSSLMFFGSDRTIASSLCASVALSLIRQKAHIHLFNGDRRSISSENQDVPHPFMYLSQNYSDSSDSVRSYKPGQLCDVVGDLYAKYLKRQKEAQDLDEIPDYQAEFLIINDLFGIKSFRDNDFIGKTEASVNENNDGIFFNAIGSRLGNSLTNKGAERSIQQVLSELVKEGYRYSIYCIVSPNGDVSSWQGMRDISGVENAIWFNSAQNIEQFNERYYLREMLKNISNENGTETMAVRTYKSRFSKIRPIIYDLSSDDEMNLIDKLIKEENK